jgi:hypothetical protein
MVKKGLFLIYFFNSTILILIIHQNILFSSKWFKLNVSIVVYGRLIDAVYPLVDFIFWISIQRIKKMKDQNWKFMPNDLPNDTKCTSVQQYFKLYAGPKKTIHYNAASIQTTVLVAFFFGPGIPILFPIALIKLVLFYLFERYKLAYYYRKPP